MCEICCVFISVLTVTRWCVRYVVCSYQYLLLRGDVWDMLCVHISTYCYEVMCEICCSVFISVLTVTRWCVKYVVVCSYQYLLLRGDVWNMLCVHISTYCYEVMCEICCCVFTSVLTVRRWCVRYVVCSHQYLLLGGDVWDMLLCVHISTYCYEVMCEICCCVFTSVLTVTRWCVRHVVVCSHQYLLLRGDVWDMLLCVHISTYCYEVMCEICCCVFTSVLTVTRWCVRYVVVCSHQYLLLRGDVWDMLCVHISTYCYEVMCEICCVFISVLTVTRWCVRYVVCSYQYLLLQGDV